MTKVELVLSILVALGTPGLLIFWLRDRRRTNAEADVLEATTRHQIDLSSVTAAEAHVGLLERVFDSERQSMLRQIEDCNRREAEAQAIVGRQRLELEKAMTELQRLRDQIETLTRDLQAAMTQLAAAMDESTDPLPT